MTTRLAMAVVLLLALLAQAWGLVSVWRDDPLRSLAATKKKEAAQAPMEGKILSLQPTPLGDLPDLNEGYLFNAERSLAAGGGKNGQAQKAANVTIDKIHYSGAIITATNPRALLSYALGGQADSSGGAAANQKQGFLRVAVGDTVNGYKVTEILPEKIVFSKDGQKITKLLYDKAKDRGVDPVPLSGRGQSGQQPPPPAMSGRTPAIPDHTPGIPGHKPGIQGYVPDTPPTPAPRQDAPRTPAVRKQLKPQSQPPPSDEELRKHPLRKRPEPPPP